MVNGECQVVWTNRSLGQLKAAFDYIKKDSVKNAEKVVADIAAMVDKAARNPEIYSPDKYKVNNDGSYRAFEKHRLRISYRFANKVIRILRVRHTRMKPLMY
jgi:plasmid stabilization system protein ParE